MSSQEEALAEVRVMFPEGIAWRGAVKDVAEKYEINQGRARLLLALAGVDYRPVREPKPPREKVDRRRGPRPKADSKSGLIRAAIARRYPCMEVPHGTYTAMAEEFGVTRELVRQVAIKTGITGFAPLNKPYRACISCAGRARQGSPYCSEHLHTEVECSECKKVFRIRTVELINRTRLGRSGRGGFYCSRPCWGKYSGRNYGWGVTRKKGKIE